MPKKQEEIKTNVMRILDRSKVEYDILTYEYSEDDLSGVHAADVLGLPYEKLYKTLVLKGSKLGYFVCVIPVDKEIDLKKAAKALGDKSADMIHVKELMPLTGYIRGGCSPIGMKEQFRTLVQADAKNQEKISISAGQRGVQVVLSPNKLVELIRGEYADVIASIDQFFSKKNMAQIKKASEQIANNDVVIKSIDELEAMANS